MHEQRGIDRLFAKLTIRYGRAFMDQWPGIDPEEVKADWLHELGGFKGAPECIAWATENLPERAPNATQFRNLCRQAPRKQPPPLPAPKADPEKARAALEVVRAGLAKARNRTAAEWAREVITKHEAGEKVAPQALEIARRTLRIGITSVTEETQA